MKAVVNYFKDQALADAANIEQNVATEEEVINE
jgi:hypothetical protein